MNGGPTFDEQVPEADALEQAEAIEEEADETPAPPDVLPDDASEADALEQAQPVPERGEDEHR